MSTDQAEAIRQLTPTSKAMLTLRALANLQGAYFDELQVRNEVYRNMPYSSELHGALVTLNRKGLAHRIGRPGKYRWHITRAGLDALRSVDGGEGRAT